MLLLRNSLSRFWDKASPSINTVDNAGTWFAWLGASALAGVMALSSQEAMANVQDRPYFRANALVIVFGADDFEENGGEAPIVFDFVSLDNLGSGVAGNDLIAADGRAINLNSGRFNPIQSGEGSGWEFEINGETFGGTFNSVGPHQTLDANDSYTAFGLDDDADVDLLGNSNRASRFFVASNTAFDIYGQADNIQATGDFSSLDYTNIRYRLRYNVSGGGSDTRWGESAQDPAVGGGGVVLGQNNSFTLDDLVGAPVKVFDGGRRTAETPGSIMQQAVGFQSRYDLVGAGITGSNYDFSMGVGALSAEITYTIYTP